MTEVKLIIALLQWGPYLCFPNNQNWFCIMRFSLPSKSLKENFVWSKHKFKITKRSCYWIIMVFSRMLMQDKHGKLKNACIAVNLIKFENTIINHQLPVHNNTNIITIITNNIKSSNYYYFIRLSKWHLFSEDEDRTLNTTW